MQRDHAAQSRFRAASAEQRASPARSNTRKAWQTTETIVAFAPAGRQLLGEDRRSFMLDDIGTSVGSSREKDETFIFYGAPSGNKMDAEQKRALAERLLAEAGPAAQAAE
jgi:hypothetical protein